MKRLIAALLSAVILAAGAFSAAAAEPPAAESGTVSYTHQQGKVLNIPVSVKLGSYRHIILSIKSSKKIVGLLASSTGGDTGAIVDPDESKLLVKKNSGDDFPTYKITTANFSLLNSQSGMSYAEETELFDLAVYGWGAAAEDKGLITIQILEIYDENLIELADSDYELKYRVVTPDGSDTDSDLKRETDSDVQTDSDTAIPPVNSDSDVQTDSDTTVPPVNSDSDVHTDSDTTIPPVSSDSDFPSPGPGIDSDFPFPPPWVVDDSDTPSDHEHVPVIDKGYPATCEHKGLTDGSHCSICGRVLEPQVRIDVVPHTIVTQPAIEPTCTEPGRTEASVCSVCGEVFSSSEEIPPLGHSLSPLPAIEATCEKTGLTAGWRCTRCGEITVPQEEVPKKSHEYVDGVCIYCGAKQPGASADTDTDESKPADTDPDGPSKPADTDTDPDGPSKPAALPGDVDHDGALTANDALIILRTSLSLNTLSAADAKIADVDEDGMVLSSDALIVLRRSLGL